MPFPDRPFRQARPRAEAMIMSRVWAMPSADTFTIEPIADFVRRWYSGVGVDPFARNSQFATWRNDLDQNTDAPEHMDAEYFLNQLMLSGVTADCVILDPPYSPRQISECYKRVGLAVGTNETQNGALYRRVRLAARGVCKVGTVVLSFGWNSCGMGNGFCQEEILLVAHGGAHNDTICLAERMIAQQLEIAT